MQTLKKSIEFKTAFTTFLAGSIIGEGGSGRVYAAVDEAGRDVAIKMLDPLRATKEKIKRFQNEYHFCRTCEHPHIIRVLDHGLLETNKQASPFFVMPRYERSLRGFLSSAVTSEDKLRIFGKILDGVEAAHLLKVWHRDLKPENILLRNGTAEVVVADFGIAHFGEDELYTLVETSAHSRLANFVYAAPEQRTPGKAVDQKADIYALGLILNEMFTGSVAYGTDFRKISGADPNYAYLDELVEGMLRQKRVDRIESIEEIKKQLIARKNEFIALQHLDAARKRVVPSSDVVDPFFDDPPRILGVDWDGKMLTIKFHRQIQDAWINALHDMGGYTAVYGKDPRAFHFRGETASISATEHEVQRIIDQFKQWIPQAHKKYQYTVHNQRRQAEEAERERIRLEAETADRRARVLSQIRF